MLALVIYPWNALEAGNTGMGSVRRQPMNDASIRLDSRLFSLRLWSGGVQC